MLIQFVKFVELIKLSKRHNNKKQTKYQWKNYRIQRTAISMQKMWKKKFGIYNNPLIGKK